MLMADEPPTVVARYDLRDTRIFQLLFDAVTTMLAGGQRIITVVDKPPNMSGDEIELAMSEVPLFAAMVGYAVNILALSVLLSIIAAGLPHRPRSTSVVPSAASPTAWSVFASNQDQSRIIRFPTAMTRSGSPSRAG